MTYRHFLPTLLRTLRSAAGFVLPALALGLAAPAGAQVVISQVYGGGGNTGATWKNDYVELHNKGTTAVSLSNWSLQYAPAANVPSSSIALSGNIPAGGFFLIGFATGGSPGATLPSTDASSTGTNIAVGGGKFALISGSQTLLSAPASPNPAGLAGTNCPTIPTGVKLEDYVGWGAASCYKTLAAPAQASTNVQSIVRAGNSCLETGNNGNDFIVQTFGATPTAPRNSASPAQACPVCGPGIALTTSPTALWQQLSLACVPASGASTVGTVIGSGTTTSGKLNSANYDTRWSIWKRNATNSGNVQMALTDTITAGTGHWIKSLDAPSGGTLIISSAQAAETPLTTGVTGCMTDQGCVVLPVASATAAARMIANPLPYNIDWSKVRVRVGGVGGTVYTPSAAQTAGMLSNQIWIYNGTSYATWSDTAPNVGNLQYFKSFFVKVLATGVGKTIDLLVPALVSTLTTPTPLPKAGGQAGSAGEPRAALPQGLDAVSSRSAWLVDLSVENVDAGWSATAKLGQWPGTETGLDAGDLAAMAPFAEPYLTIVFPHFERRIGAGDFSTDLRPDNAAAGKWDFEVRAQPLGSTVMLRWNAPPAALAKSRIVDRDTGAVLYVNDPNYADGYPITLNTPVRRLTWEYMGN